METNIFAEVRTDFFDEETNRISIDAWRTFDNDEEGKVLGWIDAETQQVIWAKDTTAEEKNCPLVKEEIKNALEELKNE